MYVFYEQTTWLYCKLNFYIMKKKQANEQMQHIESYVCSLQRVDIWNKFGEENVNFGCSEHDVV
jgi:hypothetical protein